MKTSFSIFLFVSLLIWSCAPTKLIKPLEKGEQRILGHFGGPVASVPGIGSIPLPFTSLGYANGIWNKTTVFGSIYPTSMLFGVAQADIGSTSTLWSSKKNNQGLSISPSVNIVVDCYTGENRFWPQVDMNYYIDYLHYKTFDGQGKLSREKQNSAYLGISNWFDPYLYESQGRKNEQFWIPSLQIGHAWQRKRWSYQLECKLLAPIYSNEDIVVNYPSFLGNKGAIGAYFTLQYSILK